MSKVSNYGLGQWSDEFQDLLIAEYEKALEKAYKVDRMSKIPVSSTFKPMTHRSEVETESLSSLSSRHSVSHPEFDTDSDTESEVETESLSSRHGVSDPEFDTDSDTESEVETEFGMPVYKDFQPSTSTPKRTYKRSKYLEDTIPEFDEYYLKMEYHKEGFKDQDLHREEFPSEDLKVWFPQAYRFLRSALQYKFEQVDACQEFLDKDPRTCGTSFSKERRAIFDRAFKVMNDNFNRQVSQIQRELKAASETGQYDPEEIKEVGINKLNKILAYFEENLYKKFAALLNRNVFIPSFLRKIGYFGKYFTYLKNYAEQHN